MMADNNHEAVIIGGGFYGAAIAIYLAKRGLKRILLVEQEPTLFSRASYNNQARVHNGYHYPRSFTTAYRSRHNMPTFISDWPQAVKRDFIMLYAIARGHHSKVTAKQFERFCREIGATLQPAEAALCKLFEPRLIEKVFLVEEYVFDATTLRAYAEDALQAQGVQVRVKTRATAISQGNDNTLRVMLQSAQANEELMTCRYVFNCTYSGLNQFEGDFPRIQTGIKHEITEMPLMQMPTALQGLGVTVMDGPFFSMMPFPARGLHTLSHVRYTPHRHWEDQFGIDPYQTLKHYACETRVDRMVRDTARYLPAIREATYVESLFEVKTILQKNEGDDGRPILFEKSARMPGCYSILGGKIDNIYDVLEKLEAEDFRSMYDTVC